VAVKKFWKSAIWLFIWWRYAKWQSGMFFGTQCKQIWRVMALHGRANIFGA